MGKILLVLDTFDLQLCTPLELSGFESLLSTHLIKLGLAVLGSLLKLTKTLDFSFFLFFNAGIFSNFGLFTLQLSAVELRNFGVHFPFGIASSLFLRKGVFVGNLNLFVHDLNSLPLCFHDFRFLFLDLFNVLKHQNFLTLQNLFFLQALHLTLLNLIDDDSSSPLTSVGRTFFPLVLGLDRLESLNLHH